jgi:hypothetical protein
MKVHDSFSRVEPITIERATPKSNFENQTDGNDLLLRESSDGDFGELTRS